MSEHHNDRRIDYIELAVRDMERTKAFYGRVFGWTFVDYGRDYTSFSDGRLSGGFTTQERVRPGGALVIMYADNLEHMRDAVIDAGGSIVKDIFAFPGGRRFHFGDPSGHVLAVWSSQ